MSATEFNILTITEPAIELEPFEIADSESDPEDGEGPKNLPESSTFMGDTYPAIRVNSYDFNKQDIAYFELELNDFIPRLRVTVEDNNGLFTVNSYPKDGDCLILIIKSFCSQWHRYPSLPGCGKKQLPVSNDTGIITLIIIINAMLFIQ